MPIVIIALLVILLLGFFISATLSLLGFLVMLAVAALVGALADALVPGRLPFGWLGAIAAGLLGSWLGSLLLGRIGPDIAGIPVISALIGAMILAFAFDLIGKHAGTSRTA